MCVGLTRIMHHPIPTIHPENSDGEAEQRSAGSEPKFEKSKLRAFITQGGGKVLQVINSAVVKRSSWLARSQFDLKEFILI